MMGHNRPTIGRFDILHLDMSILTSMTAAAVNAKLQTNLHRIVMHCVIRILPNSRYKLHFFYSQQNVRNDNRNLITVVAVDSCIRNWHLGMHAVRMNLQQNTHPKIPNISVILYLIFSNKSLFIAWFPI